MGSQDTRLEEAHNGERLLEVEGLTAVFRTPRGVVRAVNDVSFTVDRGELVGVVGESGCGKSATIRSIIGLLRPPGEVIGGRAVFRGEDLVAAPARRRRRLLGTAIGFVPQNPFGSLNPVMRIDAQFDSVINAHGRASRKETRATAERMLVRAGVPDPDRVLDGYAHQLSGGMAQRTVLSIAMCLDPDLVIADEPTTGLDVTVQRQILDTTLDLVRENSRSMLLVTHDLGVVAHYCNRVIVMYAGRVIEHGPVSEVFVRPAHPYTDMLLRAVPREGRELAVIRGRIPDLIDYPPGCPFYARCDHRGDPRCATELPPLREVGPGHHAATFYALSASGGGAA